MSRNLITLRQRKIEVAKQAHLLLDRAKADGRGLTSEEESRYDGFIAKLDEIETQIDAQVMELERERGISRGDDSALVTAEIGARAPLSHSRVGKRMPRRYAEMFPGALSSRGFSSLDEFLRTVHSGLNDPRLQATAQGMGVNVPTDGGFLVPTQFAAEMLDVALENEIVRPRAYVTPMTTSTKKIAGLDDLDNSGAAPYGGFSVQ